MPDSVEQAQFRRHLAEMRQAAGGLGRDFHSEFSDLDRKIERFGHTTSRQAKELGAEISDDFSNLGKRMDEEMRRFPARVAAAGTAIGSGTVWVAGTTRDAMISAGHKAKRGTKNAFATAAGVRTKPIKTWSPPMADGGPSAVGDEP